MENIVEKVIYLPKELDDQLRTIAKWVGVPVNDQIVAILQENMPQGSKLEV